MDSSSLGIIHFCVWRLLENVPSLYLRKISEIKIPPELARREHVQVDADQEQGKGLWGREAG